MQVLALIPINQTAKATKLAFIWVVKVHPTKAKERLREYVCEKQWYQKPKAQKNSKSLGF